MRASQLHWSEPTGWINENPAQPVDLVLYFGTREALACGARYRELRAMFPGAHPLGCSTSYGEISPHAVSGCCELHNQTMTVTTLSEAA